LKYRIGETLHVIKEDDMRPVPESGQAMKRNYLPEEMNVVDGTDGGADEGSTNFRHGWRSKFQIPKENA
jgi:hypothetical protein